jgi:hydrogenase expression/formation protein HypC
MCLAIPGKVLNLSGEDPAFRSANVDFCGVRKTVNLAFTPEVQPGDYVLVHVGFAISRIDREEARRTFEYLKQTGALSEEGFAQPAAECAAS